MERRQERLRNKKKKREINKNKMIRNVRYCNKKEIKINIRKFKERERKTSKKY